MIHVCFALYDKTGHYSKFTGTAMLSMFDNHIPPPTAPSITVHILHDNTLSTENRDKFIYLAGQYGQLVKFYNVEVLCADKLTEIKQLVSQIVTKSRFTLATFYRFLILNVLPENIDRCIYLDSDIIVNLDIKELWQIELGDKPLAAAPEVEINYLDHPVVGRTKFLVVQGLTAYEDYFNSGVLMMNLTYLRRAQDRLLEGVKFLNSHPEMKHLDQDILNWLFSKDYVKLAEKFNVFVNIERRRNGRKPPRKAIYHYIYITLQLENDLFNRLWMSYFIRTPFFDAEAIGRLYDGFNKTQFGLKQSLIQLSALMSGKTRAFFTAPDNVNAVKGIFFVRDDEEIIPAKDNESLKKLLYAMNASRGRKIFFIIFPNFPFEVLKKFGFVPGRDFINGVDFLYDIHGLPTDSHPLIKAM